MSDGYNWIRAKDCNGLVEMEKGKQKRELISEFLEDLDSNMWIKDIVKKWKKRLKQ